MKLNINLRYGRPVLKGGDFQLKKKYTSADQKKVHLLIKKNFSYAREMFFGCIATYIQP